MSLFFKVYFVSSYDKTDIVSQHFPEFFNPVFDFGEAVCVSYVVDEYSSIGITVVNWSQCVKSFLTRCVPYRKGNTFSTNIQPFAQERRLKKNKNSLNRSNQYANTFLKLSTRHKIQKSCFGGLF